MACMAVWLYRLYALYSVSRDDASGLYVYNIQPIQQVLIQESIQPHPTSTWLLGTDGRGIRSVAHELIAGLWL